MQEADEPQGTQEAQEAQEGPEAQDSQIIGPGGNPMALIRPGAAKGAQGHAKAAQGAQGAGGKPDPVPVPVIELGKIPRTIEQTIFVDHRPVKIDTSKATVLAQRNVGPGITYNEYLIRTRNRMYFQVVTQEPDTTVGETAVRDRLIFMPEAQARQYYSDLPQKQPLAVAWPDVRVEDASQEPGIRDKKALVLTRSIGGQPYSVDTSKALLIARQSQPSPTLERDTLVYRAQSGRYYAIHLTWLPGESDTVTFLSRADAETAYLEADVKLAEYDAAFPALQLKEW